MGMKIETTIALSEELLVALSSRAPDAAHRSKLVEAALWAYLLRLRRRDASNDLEIINANAAGLNAEAEGALSYQVIP
jgi:hypothetical protein